MSTSGELSREDWLGKYGPAPPSVDSAVESWDSSALDPPGGSTPAQSKRDSGSDIIFRSGIAVLCSALSYLISLFFT